MKFIKGKKRNNTTDIIKLDLKYCIGKDTVEVYEDINKRCVAIYHFNSLIAVYDVLSNCIYFNKRYYDFSSSTSRVRNVFSNFYMGVIPPLKELRKIEKDKISKCYLTAYGRFTVFVEDIEE